MDFTDRNEELRRLQGVAGRPEGALIVVWGRRRVGKTRLLLLEWVRSRDGLYWVAEASAAPLQRRNLAETLESRLPGFGQVEYPDWGSLFSRLAVEARRARWRGPLVIDEVPYLVSASPDLPSVLQRFVDHQGREAGFLLALAGSSQHMMQGLTLDANAPLYGRARELMKLRPIPAGYIGDALRCADAAEAVRAYSLWGGIPRYWELAEPWGDLRSAVDALALDPLGPLHDEPNRLLLEESPPAIALRPLLDAIGAGAHRVSEIAGRIGQPATSLARPLTRLQELDLVVREVPFGETERSSKRALYKLGDPFVRLWFSLIAPRRSLLMQVPREARLRLFDDAFPRFTATVWEELCRLAVPLLGERLGGVEFGPAGRYWAGGGPEWDVLSESLDSSAVLVGEVKWVEGKASAASVDDAVRALMAKGLPPVRRPAGAEVHHVVFVSRLPARSPRVRAPNLHVLDAKDVMSVLR